MLLILTSLPAIKLKFTKAHNLKFQS